MTHIEDVLLNAVAQSGTGTSSAQVNFNNPDPVCSTARVRSSGRAHASSEPGDATRSWIQAPIATPTRPSRWRTRSRPAARCCSSSTPTPSPRRLPNRAHVVRSLGDRTTIEAASAKMGRRLVHRRSLSVSGPMPRFILVEYFGTPSMFDPKPKPKPTEIEPKTEIEEEDEVTRAAYHQGPDGQSTIYAVALWGKFLSPAAQPVPVRRDAGRRLANQAPWQGMAGRRGAPRRTAPATSRKPARRSLRILTTCRRRFEIAPDEPHLGAAAAQAG